MSGKEKWTARGTGKCPKCTFTFSTFKTPERCTQCQFYLGGKFVPKEGTSSNRKRKLNNPEAESVCSFAKIHFIQLILPTEMTEVFAWWLAQVGSAILILVETYVH